jgi:adenosylmethionine-8-amino-7-oxononanoate aminotransferase
MSVGGVDLYHATFRDLLFTTQFVPPPYCYRCPIGKNFPECSLACTDMIEKKLSGNKGLFAAMIIEPLVQCPGGIITAPTGYLKKVSDICKRHDVLLIADEVAVGFGRTGKMFAVEHENVTPDIMALSKSITGGTLPFAATMTTDKIYDAFLGSYESQKTFFHGHTYTANQLGAAVAIENLKLYDERSIVEKFKEKGERLADLLKRFKDLSHVGDIRQRGLIAGIELVSDKSTKGEYAWQDRVGLKVCSEAKKNGLLVRPLGNVIVLFPAPVMSIAELNRVTDILHDSIVTVTGE